MKKTRRRNNNFPFIDHHLNYITSYDENNEDYFYDFLNYRYLRDNGEIDINLLKNKIKITLLYYNGSNKKYKCKKMHSNIKKQYRFFLLS